MAIPSPLYEMNLLVNYYNDSCNTSLHMDKNTITCDNYGPDEQPQSECCNSFMNTNYGKIYDLNKCYDESMNKNYSHMLIQCYVQYSTDNDSIFIIVFSSILFVLFIILFLSYYYANICNKCNDCKLKHKPYRNINTQYGAINNEYVL
jgi:hypothetical protein